MRHQAALYALGLLTQHEAYCFELHLEECRVCRAESAKLLLASAQIGLAVKEEEPTEGFRERLAARIDSSPRNKPLPGLPEKQEPAPVAPPFKPVKTPKTEKKTEPAKKNLSIPAIAPMPPAPPPRSRKTAFFKHAIIYAIFAALCAYAYYLWQNNEEDKIELQSLKESAENAQSDLKRQLESQRENTVKLERFQELLSDPYTRVTRLKGQASTPDIAGAVLWNILTDDITVIGAFNPAPAGMFYRLWLSSPSEMFSVGQLPSDNGRVFTTVKLNQGSLAASSGITAIVTLESESDVSTRTEPAEPWVASGKIE